MTISTERAVLAGGCFWGVQDLLRRYPGVISTRVGYTGGEVPNATYRNHGNHAEAIEITFDPQTISYRLSHRTTLTRGRVPNPVREFGGETCVACLDASGQSHGDLLKHPTIAVRIAE